MSPTRDANKLEASEEWISSIRYPGIPDYLIKSVTSNKISFLKRFVGGKLPGIHAPHNEMQTMEQSKPLDAELESVPDLFYWVYGRICARHRCTGRGVRGVS